MKGGEGGDDDSERIGIRSKIRDSDSYDKASSSVRRKYKKLSPLKFVAGLSSIVKRLFADIDEEDFMRSEIGYLTSLYFSARKLGNESDSDEIRPAVDNSGNKLKVYLKENFFIQTWGKYKGMNS